MVVQCGQARLLSVLPPIRGGEFVRRPFQLGAAGSPESLAPRLYVPSTFTDDSSRTICMMVPTLLADKNPEVRGNPIFQRFSKTIHDLWKTVNPESP